MYIEPVGTGLPDGPRYEPTKQNGYVVGANHDSPVV